MSARRCAPLLTRQCRSPVWMRFDAAGAAAVGGWAAVCDACARARLQPEALFFERTLTVF